MKENNVVVVKEKRLAGNIYYFPGNDVAEKILKLTKSTSGKRVCLTQNDIECLKDLGFTINVLKPKVIYE